MPANATGWFWHCLARETGKIGHLYGPGAQRGPWPWFPFALDNGAFSCWDPILNLFDATKWAGIEPVWRQLVRWAAPTGFARWGIVPDVPGDSEATFARWYKYASEVRAAGIPTALAVQDGMTAIDVRRMRGEGPAVICVGGTTEWKWATVEHWRSNFERVHVLRCNSPEKLALLESLGIESCDGTGWNRGDQKQTSGLEAWARQNPEPITYPLSPFVCRTGRQGTRSLFAH